MVQWLMTCSLNMEMEKSERFKLSHLHLGLVEPQVYKWVRFLSAQLKFELTINEFIIDDLTINEFSVDDLTINEFD